MTSLIMKTLNIWGKYEYFPQPNLVIIIRFEELVRNDWIFGHLKKKIKVKDKEETMGKLLFDFLIFHKIKIMGVFNSTFIWSVFN